MSPDLSRSDPLFLQIAQSIAKDIRSGKLGESDTVPSARAISASWGVALATATKALQRLKEAGLTEALPGVGTVVATRNTGFGGAGRLRSTRTSGKIYGVDEVAEILSAAVVEANADVSEALGLAAGASAIRRERLTRRSGVTASHSVSWFSGDVADRAPLLLVTQRILEGTFSYLQHSLGVVVDHGWEASTAVGANPAQATVLGVHTGAPILASRTWFMTEDETVLEYGESVRVEGTWSIHRFTHR